MTTNEMADKVQNWLLDKGFVIQRLDAITTQSIYLKLDYGLCNTIRISDHKGKKEYSYRYNLTKNLPEHTFNYFTNGKYPRAFYSFDNVKKLLEDIVIAKNKKIFIFGTKKYKELMEKNRTEKENSKGFWLKSTLIGGEN